MELIDVNTQETIMSMINDVNKISKVPAFKSDGSMYEKGKYEDALNLITDSFDEEELTERLKNVLPNVFKDWQTLASINLYSFNTRKEDVENLYDSQGIPKGLLVFNEEKVIEEDLNDNLSNTTENKRRKNIMPELTQEQKAKYAEDQKRLKNEYQQNIQAEMDSMFSSKEKLEEEITKISNTSPNLSLTNRLALANQGIYDDLLTREAWGKMGFTPKGETVKAHISSPNGTFKDSSGKERLSFKQQAVYGTESFEKQKNAEMAFSERQKANSLIKYDSTIRNESYMSAVSSLNKTEPEGKNTLELELAKYLYRKDNKLIKHDVDFKLKDEVAAELPEDKADRKKLLMNVSKKYKAIEEKAKTVAFAKEQERAKEKDTPELEQKRKEQELSDEGLTLS